VSNLHDCRLNVAPDTLVRLGFSLGKGNSFLADWTCRTADRREHIFKRFVLVYNNFNCTVWIDG
jgi:hypothetical protein